MCGIFAIVNKNTSVEENKLYGIKEGKKFGDDEYHDIINDSFMLGTNRGPESQTLLKIDNNYLGFHRLAINGYGNKSSEQPIKKHNCTLICNGEIYNWKHLEKISKTKCTTGSDCEIILNLYKKYGIEQTLQMLDGVFAFVIYDHDKNDIIVGRDTFGVRPLFMCYKQSNERVLNNSFNQKSNIYFASEFKQLVKICEYQENLDFKKNSSDIEFVKTQFPPGHYLSFSLDEDITEIKTKCFSKCNSFPTSSSTNYKEMIRDSLIQAVTKRVENTDREIACLLSGGLDSSLITGLVVRICKLKYNRHPSTIHTWSIGMSGSEDLEYARKVAGYLGTTHHSIELSEKEFLDSIEEVIYTIESNDTTTIRASVGNWLIAKYIKAQSKAKVIFNGDGSDELTGGYLYFHAAPDSIDFDKECRRLLSDIYLFDVLRSDRCIASHGLEARTPFLDRGFVQTYLSIPVEIRDHAAQQKCEKYLLRETFADMNIIPDEVLWRTKEAFSDGVSSQKKSWFETIQDFAQIQYPTLSKKNAETKYYDSIYKQFYGSFNSVPYKWMPKFVDADDASARTLKIYGKNNKKNKKNNVKYEPKNLKI